MIRGILLAAAAATAWVSSEAAFGQTRSEGRRSSSELGYFLPRTKMAATVHQLIRRCPTVAQPKPLIATTIAISERAGPDPAAFVRLSLRGGALTGRTTKLGLRPDGTLSAFNAKSTGEAGQVLSAVISTATTLASLGAGGAPALDAGWGRRPPQPALACTAETEELVNQMTETERQIAQLRANVAAGSETSATAQVLASLTAELAGLVERLTLRAAPLNLDPAAADFASGPALVRHIGRVDFTSWFGGAATEQALAAADVPGRNGFRFALQPNAAIRSVYATGDGSPPVPSGATTRFYYRRPVPASATVAACRVSWSGTDCDADPSAATSAQKTVMLPQLSGAFSLPIGRSNLFGTRTTSATFDEQGAPLTLEYGSTRGGADIAGVINAGNTGIATLRDSDTAANTRRIAEIKAERELAALLAAP